MGFLQRFRHATPLTPAEARLVKGSFIYVKTWKCPCGSQLRIRSREPHLETPSNFAGLHANALGVYHSRRTPGELNWDGLAEERGWEANPVRCPACRLGMSRQEYKQARREGRI